MSSKIVFNTEPQIAPEKPKKKTQDPKEKFKKLLKSFLIKLGIFSLILALIFIFVGGFARVPDNDMFPRFLDGDLLVYSKLSKPQTGDVVVYKLNGKTKVGRVFAVSGDVVNIAETNYLTLNGVLPYEAIFYETTKKGDEVKYPVELQNNQFFIMGDQRQAAIDSRTFGPISSKDIKGVVFLLVLRSRGL